MYRIINAYTLDTVGYTYATLTEAEQACRMLNVLRGRCIYRVLHF